MFLRNVGLTFNGLHGVMFQKIPLKKLPSSEVIMLPLFSNIYIGCA
jgi:hypothetical protein